MSTKAQKSPATRKAGDRADRLKAALKANIARRKEQAAARKGQNKDD